MSDTPRTDFVAHAKAWANGAKDKIVQLERELAKAIAKERERCAKVCEEFYSVENIAQKCAAAIRKGE